MRLFSFNNLAYTLLTIAAYINTPLFASQNNSAAEQKSDATNGTLPTNNSPIKRRTLSVIALKNNDVPNSTSTSDNIPKNEFKPVNNINNVAEKTNEILNDRKVALKNANTTILELKKKLEKVNKELAEEKQKTVKTNFLREENVLLKNAFNQLKNEKKEYENTINQQKKSINDIQLELNLLTEKNNIINEIENELDSVKQLYSESQKTNKKLNTKIENLSQEKTSLKTTNTKLESELESQSNTHQKTIENLKKKYNQGLKDQKTNYESQINKLNLDITTLQSQLKSSSGLPTQGLKRTNTIYIDPSSQNNQSYRDNDDNLSFVDDDSENENTPPSPANAGGMHYNQKSMANVFHNLSSIVNTPRPNLSHQYSMISTNGYNNYEQTPNGDDDDDYYETLEIELDKAYEKISLLTTELSQKDNHIKNLNNQIKELLQFIPQDSQKDFDENIENNPDVIVSDQDDLSRYERSHSVVIHPYETLEYENNDVPSIKHGSTPIETKKMNKHLTTIYALSAALFVSVTCNFFLYIKGRNNKNNKKANNGSSTNHKPMPKKISTKFVS